MDKLIAEKLKSDPRVVQAKTLLQEALSDAQKTLTGPMSPDKQREESYRELLDACAQARGGGLYYPYLGSGVGKGALVELADGSVKYDFISGIGPHFWGHSHPDMLEASIDAALGDTVMQGNLQQNVDSLNLLEQILQLAQLQGDELQHCFLSTSGASANENALKLVLQKHSPANRILCFEKCFAGRTLALSQMTDKAAYRDGLPTAMAVDYIPFLDPADPEGSTARAVTALRAHLQRFPKLHAAMCLELIQGEAGYYPGSRAFFVALFEVLKEAGIAIWIDEVQTFGRTEKPFAFQYFELDRYVDIVTIGKLSQVCATLFRPDYKPRPGLISQTFTASTSAIAAAEVIMKAFLEGSFFGVDGKNAQCHQRFVSHLKRISAKAPDKLSGPFGVGAMIAFTVHGGDAAKSKQFADDLFKAGVISFIAGANPMRIRFLMPVAAITHDDIDRVCALIEETLHLDA